MNGVNALIARGGNFPQAPMPDMMRSYRGAQAAKSMQNQLALQRGQLAAQPEEQAWRREARGQQRKQWAQTEEDRKFEREIKALNMAIKAGSPEKAKAIYKNLSLIDDDYDFDFTAGKVSFESKEGFALEGPPQAIEQLLTILDDNLQGVTDPAKQNAIMSQIFRAAPRMGINVKEPVEKEEDKPTYEHHTIYGPGGATRRISYKKGQDYTPPAGWSLSKPAKPEKGEEKAKTKKLTDIASDYQQAIGRYYSLMSGVGIMSEALGKQNQKMAEEAKVQADNLAKQYKDLGGDVADLGVMEAENKSLRDRAIEILKKNNKVISEETIIKVMDRLEG